MGYGVIGNTPGSGPGNGTRSVQVRILVSQPRKPLKDAIFQGLLVIPGAFVYAYEQQHVDSGNVESPWYDVDMYPWKQSAMALRVMSRQRLRAHIAYLYDLLAMYERNDEANRERAVDLSLGLVSFEAGGQYFFTYVLSQVHARNRMEQVHVLTGHPVKNFGVLYECEDEVQRLSQRSYGEIWVADDPLGRGLKPFLEGIGASLD